MAANRKIRYEIDISAQRPEIDASEALLRLLEARDQDALAELMLEAYVDTIDYEGETLKEALDEVNDWFEGAPLLQNSFGAIVGERLVSAALLMNIDDAPFIAFVMTHPDYKRMGLGRTVVEAAIKSLKRSSQERVVFCITDGNTPSEQLFASAGAQPKNPPPL